MVSVPLRRGPPLAAKGRNSMKSSDLIFAIALVGLIGGTAQATPLGLSRSLGSPSLSVLPVHGCHHTYAHDLQGWHLANQLAVKKFALGGAPPPQQRGRQLRRPS